MRRLLVIIAIVTLCGGYAYADDDEISRQLEQEALQAINTHNAKLEAEESTQKQKDQELEKQRSLQAEQIRKEAEQKRQQEIVRKASAKGEEERARAEEERRRLALLDIQLKLATLEAERKARIAQILHNMQQTLDAVDAKHDAIRAREHKEIQDTIRANRQEAALSGINARLNDLRAQQEQLQQQQLLQQQMRNRR